MFGYVKAPLESLTPEQQTRYRAHYCGLCQSLGRLHGLPGQMALTYDLIFLTAFLCSLYEPEEMTGEGRCVPHPVKKHSWVRSKITDYAADMTIALTWHKLQDDWQDAGYYKQLLELYVKFADQMEAVHTWGTVDNLSWRAENYPLLFDAMSQPKPAFYAIVE